MSGARKRQREVVDLTEEEGERPWITVAPSQPYYEDEPEPKRPRATVGVDLGTKNLGLGVLLDDQLRLARVNLTVEKVEGVQFKVALAEGRFTEVAHRLVVSNQRLWPMVCEVGLERQVKSGMKQLAQAIAGVIKGAYPHITIRHVSPVETRAYFNTRVLDKNLTQDEKYAIRKNLSKQTMHKFYAPADAERALELLGAKSDDAIEAGLLAIYCHNVPCTDEAKRKRLKKTRNSDKPLVSFCARTRFASGAQVRLTDAERKQVYGDTKEELKERKAAKKERAERKARGEKKKKKAKPKKPKKEKAAPGRRKGVRPAPPSP